MKRKILIILFILVTLGIGAYNLFPHIIMMYACAEGGGKYSWVESRCIPYQSKEKEQAKNSTQSSVLNNGKNAQKNILPEQFQDFNKIWGAFRQAVIEQDTAKISGFTKFPFETRGPMDSDPIAKYSQKDFPKVFKAFLSEPVLEYDSIHDQDKEINQFEVIRKTIVLKKEYVTDSWARVGNLEFNKVNNRWYLTFAYLEYPTIESLEKDLN